LKQPITEIKAGKDILPEGYYLENMERLLRFVLKERAHLLARFERSRAQGFLSLPLAARRLYTRLYSRRGPSFLLSSLFYAEIPEVERTARELADRGFLAIIQAPRDTEEATQLFSLFTKEQLLSIVKRRFGSMVNKLKKEQLLTALLDHPDDWMHTSHERFVRLLDAEIFSLCEVLFFGNRHQSLTDFILVDLAKIAYFPYSIGGEFIFTDREQIARYLSAAKLLERASETTNKDEALSMLPGLLSLLTESSALPAHQRLIDPRRYWQRAAFFAARESERHGESDAAKSIYEALSQIDAEPHTQAEAIDRFGMLCKRGNDAASLEALYQKITKNLDALSLFQLETRRAKLSLCDDPKRALREAPVISLSLTQTGHQGAKATYRGKQSEALSIEQATLEVLGGDGKWAENGLWLTLFGVLCWEAIFAPLDGVFIQPFQAGPLDLWSDSFFERRRELFDTLFARLSSDPLAALETNDPKYRGYACHFTLWEEYPLPLLRRVVESLGVKLIAILRRIAQNPNRHSNGLPDLLVFDAEGLLLVEVKGPGDSIRLAQRLWHDYLLRAGVRVRLAKVTNTK
jgi:hypothetical protein